MNERTRLSLYQLGAITFDDPGDDDDDDGDDYCYSPERTTFHRGGRSATEFEPSYRRSRSTPHN